MATIKDMEGRELTASDKGLLLMLGVCGDLTYLEKKRLKEMFMPQYTEVQLAIDHPMSARLKEMRELIKLITESEVRKIKAERTQKSIKRNKRNG